MGKFVKDPDRLRPCKGTCGRMTRNTKMLARDFPDSVVRVNADYCAACQKDIAIANGTYKAPPSEAKSEEIKARTEAERIAAAFRARETLERQRRERQARAGRAHLARQIAAQRGRISA
jgi:hypothetical protein